MLSYRGMIEKVTVQNFRSYKRGSFGLGPVTVVVGGNGAGKSNLMEAMYMLASGKSFRAEADVEMIRYQQTVATIDAELSSGERMKIILNDGTYGTTRKKFELNGVGKRGIDFVGLFRAVCFSPTDMELVTGSPSGRRRYLDFVISQTDRDYRRDLVAYEKGLRQRNRLLDLIRDGRAGRNQLFFWDRLLLKNGEYITQKREEYLDGLSRSLEATFSTEYDKSVISEARLKQYEVEEVAAGSTLVGPHRDDFVVKLKDRDVSKYGSRGEQRMAVLWLKLGERDYLTDGTLPVLLLDDIFSELDHAHREEVTDLVEEQRSGGGQVIMTTTDEHLVPKIKGAKIIRL